MAAEHKIDAKVVGLIIGGIVAALGGGGFALSQKEYHDRPVMATSSSKMEQIETRQIEIMQRISALETRQEVILNMVKDIQKDLKYMRNHNGLVALARREEDE